jgi:hypothetical protein
MTTINPIINQYANGITTRDELKTSLVNIGFSSSIIDILLKRAEHSKERTQAEIASGEDVGRRFLPYDQCFGMGTGTPADDRQNPHYDPSNYPARVVCDGCGVLVKFSDVFVRYVEAIDMTYFYCPSCGDVKEE